VGKNKSAILKKERGSEEKGGDEVRGVVKSLKKKGTRRTFGGGKKMTGGSLARGLGRKGNLFY